MGCSGEREDVFDGVEREDVFDGAEREDVFDGGSLIDLVTTLSERDYELPLSTKLSPAVLIVPNFPTPC